MLNEEALKLAFNSKTFGFRFSASIVGGRKRLSDLIERGKIRAEKRTETQNGKWFCNAWDVIKYSSSPWVQ